MAVQKYIANFLGGIKMFIKNKLTGAIFEVTEKYYEDYQKNNKDIEVIEEPNLNYWRASNLSQFERPSQLRLWS